MLLSTVASLPALLALSHFAAAARLVVSIPSTQSLPNPATLPPSTHAVLLGPPGIRYDALLRRDNTFVFSDLPDASYLLEIHTRDHFFSPLRVDVEPAAADGSGSTKSVVSVWQTFRGNEWSNKGPRLGLGEGELMVAVRPAQVKDYYQARAGFSVLSFLKSPMILMGLVSVAMIFGMPYLMDNMDPETKAEFEEMQRKGPLTGSSGAATQIQNFDLAGWMAGSKTSGSDGGAAAGSVKKR